MNEAGSRAGISAPPARPIGVLQSVVQQIMDRIHQIDERQDILGQGINRLVNPRPTSAAENIKAERDPDTHEAQLQVIVRRLDSILSRAADQADTLNSSV